MEIKIKIKDIDLNKKNEIKNIYNILNANSRCVLMKNNLTKRSECNQ